HAQSGKNSSNRVFALLGEGKRVVLVTDAGTPGISDPGSELVAAVREKFGSEVRIEALPGPSALTAALSIAGLPSSEFLFLGFFPHKKGRQTLFKYIASEKRTVVFYESTHRIGKALQSLAELLPEDRQVVVCRELSKIYEEVVSGTAEQVRNAFLNRPERTRGEFVVVVGP